MSATHRRRAWEYSKSVWMFLTLVPYLGFLAYFYIGLRTRQNKWIWWGVFYSLPLLYMMFGPSVFDVEWGGILSWPGAIFNWFVNAFLYFLAACVFSFISFLHALAIRREYLVRRSVMSERVEQDLHGLRNDLEVEYGVNVLGGRIGRERRDDGKPKSSRQGKQTIFPQEDR